MVDYVKAPIPTNKSIKGLSLLTVNKNSFTKENSVLGRVALTDPDDDTILLQGPSTYQSSLYYDPGFGVPIGVIHSKPEGLIVARGLLESLDPNLAGLNIKLLTQGGAYSGTACRTIYSKKQAKIITIISEEIVTDYIGISLYEDLGNVSAGPQWTANDLGFTDPEKLLYRWSTFAILENASENILILGLLVKLGATASLGSTENMQLYIMEFDPSLAGNARLLYIRKATSDIPFEPHDMCNMRVINKGQKQRIGLALGRIYPEKYANRLENNLLEVLEGRTVTYGAQQLNSVGIWRCNDPEKMDDWSYFMTPDINEIEIPGEHARGFSDGRFNNVDLGMVKDVAAQRVVVLSPGFSNNSNLVSKNKYA